MDQWIDELLGRLTPAQWDAWRNWIGTIGGLFALTIAALTYRRNVKLKHEEQARLVYAKVHAIEDYPAGTTFPALPEGVRHRRIASGAEYVPDEVTGQTILRATASVVSLTVAVVNRSKELIGPFTVQVVERVARVVQPESYSLVSVDPESEALINFVFTNPDATGFRPWGATLLFRDSGGQWWRRYYTDPVEAVHADPANFGGSFSGKVPLPVRARRLARRLRGKSALP